MVNTQKASTLEAKFPLLAVENDCIISKDADITVVFAVELPELYTVSSAEYEAIHSAWAKAIKVLPQYTVVHKQDWFVKEKYQAHTGNDEMSFLSRSFEKHFSERPFLNHACFLMLTKTTKQRIRMQSNFSTLCKSTLIPKDVNPETTIKFMESVGQFERIMNESGFIRLIKIHSDQITGTKDTKGIIEKYLSLSLEGDSCLQDIAFGADELRVGNKRLCMHTLSDTEDLPGRVASDSRYEKLSTDRSDCRLSFASPVGLMLSCDHIYNQYLFIENSDENLRNFEKSAKNMQSLSRYSRGNQINKQWIDKYLNEAHSYGLTSVRAHFNVMAWSEDSHELKSIRNEVGSQLANMECVPRHNSVDASTLFWAGMPGNAGDFPAEESFYTFIEPALCFFTQETNYRSSSSPFGIKMADRAGKPLHVDISDLPMKQGIITNRNKFILGPSGSGKSFFTNHMVRQYYEQGTHIVLVDTGNSYQGLCNLIHQRTGGEDGVYFTYTEQNPIAFNPFYTDDNVFDIEKRESIKTLIVTLWKRDNDPITRSEEVALSNAVSQYIDKLRHDKDMTPSFNTFYEFVRKDYAHTLKKKKVREKDFDIDNFLNVLEPYYKGGEYDFLLNSDKQLDLLSKRFIVFEIDAIKDHKILFPIVTIIIMEVFINKMRRLQGVRKMILIEEAWKAIAKEGMAEYIKYLFKTVRKFFGEAVVVTQEVDDIIASPIVKESIINNSDCKILLDQRKYMNKFDSIQSLLGLTEKEKSQILSINLNNDANRKYKEVWFGLGGVQSAVYATEVSLDEYYTYTTEELEKLEVQRQSEKLNGNLELAIKQIAEAAK